MTIFFNDPNLTPDQMVGFSKSQEAEFFSQLATHQKSIDSLIAVVIEKRVLDTVVRLKSDANTVTLDPHYEYNDEGPIPDNIMAWINGRNEWDDEHENLQNELDSVLADVSKFIHETIELDISQLKSKYNIKLKSKSRTVGHINK